MKISSTVTINADISKVFTVFTDLGKASDRISGISKLEVLEGPSKLAVGTKWKETRTVFGKEATETMWVTELSKNKSYSVDAESHGTKYSSTFTFSSVDGGTEVTWVFAGTPQTFGAKVMGLLGILFKGATQKMLEADLQDLKKACEA